MVDKRQTIKERDIERELRRGGKLGTKVFG